MKKKPIVYAKLPSAGLGNLLLVWANALVFSEINKLPLFVTGWGQIHIGPWLRHEKKKRFYGGYFLQKNLLVRIFMIFKYTITPKSSVLSDPPLKKISISENGKSEIYFYSKVPHWSDFSQLKEHKLLIKNALFNMLKKQHFEQLNNSITPEIGIHIRLSDFKESRPGESLFTAGAIRTPLTYFIEHIKNIREKEGKELHVTIFSDGHKHELEEILNINNVSLAENQSDIVDMLLLSKSKYIIPSAKSTFSYWSAFLSDAEIIFHPCHEKAPF